VARPIDVMHLGRDRVICAWEDEGFVVDPGPASCVEELLDALGGDAPRGLLLTHIHLDHAGATGVLVRRFPDLSVWVHERGAPHLLDPSKLLRSAGQLYGDDMERLWGEVAPVPERNLHVLQGGETVEGFRVAYTPGHASHHVSYLNEASGAAYTGDVAGVHVPDHDHVVAPTPPPDIDLEAWERSLAVIEDWAPETLRLTHFGEVDAVEGHLLRMREALARSGELARAHGEEAFVAAVVAEVRDAMAEDPDAAESFLQAAPPDQLYQGLERYWRKRAEREAAAPA